MVLFTVPKNRSIYFIYTSYTTYNNLLTVIFNLVSNAFVVILPLEINEVAIILLDYKDAP